SSIFFINKSGYSLPPGNIRGIMARSGLEATANFLFIGIREANIVVHQRKAGAVTNTISSALDILTLSIGLFGKSTALEAQYTAKGMPNPVPAPDIFSLPKDQAKYIGWAIMTEGGAERVTARFTITK
ncbi:MAG: hypothetical protein NTV12_08945, partial [Verrucomicrobia bacterium]|nr:hypothetical protein [Verrucomicrobiota bacterium]